eukprot:GFKZ01009358.1.p1 GENE.GFKZ01009358.1~~GFKZ01009358.1.p1  ORF type:complete len:490 (-),score=66.99 GFKZ01009358.1:192-1661(-)
MDDIVLNIAPSTWNVLKFTILTLLTTPLLEFAFHHFINRKATLDVLRGKTLRVADSRLGLFSLHATYWGPQRNRFLLPLVALPILFAELFFEFSFSIATIDVANPAQVWLPTPYQERFAISEGEAEVLTIGDSKTYRSQIPLDAIELCISGNKQMSTSGSPSETDGVYISGFEYRMGGSYAIRKPYLSDDNTSVVCSSSKTVADAFFLVPRVVRLGGATAAEGYLGSDYNSDGDENVRESFMAGGFESLFVLESNLRGAVIRNEQVVCVRTNFGFTLCAINLQDSFAVVTIPRVFFADKPEDDFTFSVVLVAQGRATEGMRSFERRVQFIAAVAGSKLLDHESEDERPSQRIVSKRKLERLALLTLIIANDEGVSGLMERTVERSILRETRVSVTMRRIAFIPISVLVIIFASIVMFDAVHGVRMTSLARSLDEKRPVCKVELTTQWFRQRILSDLQSDGLFEEAKVSDISVKLVQRGTDEYFQILPLF